MLRSNMQMMHYAINANCITGICTLIKSGLKLVFDIVEISESKVFTEGILNISFLTTKE